VRLAVIEQQPDAPAGLLGEWAHRRGARVTTLRAQELAAWPDPRAFDAVAALGSSHAVHGTLAPWIAGELGFLGDALEAEVPVLGICFGAQALVAVLGGEVAPMARPEIGWIEAQAAEPLHAGPWFAWHEDAVALPAGVRELARNGAGPQAFCHGASVGVQFHPEVTPGIVADWIASGRDPLAAHGVDEAALRAETARRAPGARERALALFDRVAAGWGAGG
jgi:GMP synthase-like glutamine amidotransferase